MLRIILISVFSTLVVGLPLNLEEELARDERSYDGATGLKFLGIGYDIINACPDGYIDFGGGGGSAGQDPGLLTTRKIIRWNGEKEENNALVPEEVTFGGNRDNCVVSSSTSMLYGAESYAQELSSSVEAGVEVGFGAFSAGFSMSKGMSSASENMNGKNQIFFKKSSICNTGRIEYNENLAGYYQHELTDVFKADVCMLPQAYSPETKYSYMKFIKRWGTHMTIDVQFGYKTLNLSRQTETELFAKVGEGSSFGMSVSGGYGPVSASVSVNTEQYAERSKTTNKMGESTAELMQGSADHPEPTKLVLKPISGLFDRKFWQHESAKCFHDDKIPSLAALKTNMETALSEYAEWLNAPTLSNLKMEFKVEWPAGEYAVLAPKGNCPFSEGFSWSKGTSSICIDIDRSDFQYWKNRRYELLKDFDVLSAPVSNMDLLQFDSMEGLILDGMEEVGILGLPVYSEIHTCAKTINPATSSQLNWGKGQYCILAMKNRGNVCPKGFSKAWLKLLDATNPPDKLKVMQDGVSPEMSTEGSNGVIDWNSNPWKSHSQRVHTSWNKIGFNFCCRNDGYTSNALLLPPNKPFVLFPVANTCQKVAWMEAEIVTVLTFGDFSVEIGPANSPTPFSSDAAGGVFRLCKYTPKGKPSTTV